MGKAPPPTPPPPSDIVKLHFTSTTQSNLTPAGVGDVADAVDGEDEVPGGQTEEVPDAVQQAVELAGMQQTGQQEEGHQEGEVQCGYGHRQVYADV